MSLFKRKPKSHDPYEILFGAFESMLAWAAFGMIIAVGGAVFGVGYLLYHFVISKFL